MAADSTMISFHSSRTWADVCTRVAEATPRHKFGVVHVHDMKRAYWGEQGMLCVLCD